MADCECGCGQATKLRKGKYPQRFVWGHNGVLGRFITLSEADWDVDAATGCWNWKHSLQASGYGQINIGGKPVTAHRAVYEKYRGEIPHGLHIDHLCRNRKCVNPEHLEPVTQRENLRRGATAKLTTSLVSTMRNNAPLFKDRAMAARYYAAQVGMTWRALHRTLCGANWT